MFSIKKLKALVKELLEKLKRAGWTVNMEMSVLKPSSRLVFLGANWDEEGVERTKEASSAIWQLLKEVTLKNFPLKSKYHQKIRGYLNYYLRFAGNVHALVNLWLKMSQHYRDLNFYFIFIIFR